MIEDLEPRRHPHASLSLTLKRRSRATSSCACTNLVVEARGRYERSSNAEEATSSLAGGADPDGTTRVQRRAESWPRPRLPRGDWEWRSARSASSRGRSARRSDDASCPAPTVPAASSRSGRTKIVVDARSMGPVLRSRGGATVRTASSSAPDGPPHGAAGWLLSGRVMPKFHERGKEDLVVVDEGVALTACARAWRPRQAWAVSPAPLVGVPWLTVRVRHRARRGAHAPSTRRPATRQWLLPADAAANAIAEIDAERSKNSEGGWTDWSRCPTVRRGDHRGLPRAHRRWIRCRDLISSGCACRRRRHRRRCA